MVILPSYSCVSTIVWLHQWNSKKMLIKKVVWKLPKAAVCCSEQILEAAPHKTTAIQPLTSHLTDHLNKTNKTEK